MKYENFPKKIWIIPDELGLYSDKRAGENTRIIDRSFITQHLTISFVKVTRVATIKWVESLSNFELDLYFTRVVKGGVLEFVLLCVMIGS